MSWPILRDLEMSRAGARPDDAGDEAAMGQRLADHLGYHRPEQITASFMSGSEAYHLATSHKSIIVREPHKIALAIC